MAYSRKRERIIAKLDDLQDGEMKEVNIGEKSILLVRINGKVHAVGGKCSHYGAPLVKGILHGQRVLCPLHQACFDVLSGNIEEPPALDALPHFDLRVEEENIIVSLPRDVNDWRTVPMARYDPEKDGRSFVIIGAGAAGHVAAETLRQVGFQGRVVMVTREKHLPYDRSQLSKLYLKTNQSNTPTLRPERFYADHDIEILMENEVVRVNPSGKTVLFQGGSSLNYDRLLLASGGIPRRLEVSGAELPGILVLRSLDDANQIKAMADKASRAVVIGASFIGMEAAASLTQCGLSVTIVAPESVPFDRILGEEIGRMYQKIHEENNVSFKLGTEVTRFEGADRVESVILNNGDRLQTDFVLLGIGVQPATKFLNGVELNPDGSVPVDRHLRVSEDLYAAGDIVNFIDWRTDERIRMEHWRLAQQHGRIAAKNMAGQEAQFCSMPFFWTTQFGVSLRYVGCVKDWNEIIFQGSISTRNFVAFYVKQEEVLAVAGCGQDVVVAAAAELMRINRMPTPKELRRDSIDLVRRLKE